MEFKMDTREKIFGKNKFVEALEKRFTEYTEDLAEGCISKIDYKNLIDELIENTKKDMKGITFKQKKELDTTIDGIMTAAIIIGHE